MSEFLFSDSSPPPTILGMGNNDFENKHPRAKDGKFTEKNRAESGLTLELESNGYPEPKSNVSTAGRKMVSEYYDGDMLVSRVFRNGSAAGEAFETHEFYRPNGKVWVRRYQGANRRLRSLRTPNEEIFNDDGSLRAVTYSPTKEQIAEHFANSNEKVVLEKSYYDGGGLYREVYLDRVKGEPTIGKNTERYNPSGTGQSVEWEEYPL